MQEMIAINILIGDRSYRVKVIPKDEEAVRRAVKVIQDKVIEFKTEFAGKDMQDYIAMVLVWFATRQTEQTFSETHDKELKTRLESIESALDTVLSSS